MDLERAIRDLKGIDDSVTSGGGSQQNIAGSNVQPQPEKPLKLEALGS
jgi:hypothetical protein